MAPASVLRCPAVRSLAALDEQFRARGLRVTSQRRAIVRAVRANEQRHPTAEDVFDTARADVPNLSLKTVYQTLHELADMGALVELDLGTGATRFDPNVDGHQHAVCVACGTVRDVPLDTRVLDASLAAVEALEDFHVGHAEVVLRGRCRGCVAEQPPS